MRSLQDPKDQKDTITSVSALGDCLRQNRLLLPAQEEDLARLEGIFNDPRELAQELVKRGWLTSFQIHEIFEGRGSKLLLGSYVLLARLGEGGMGQVFKARNWKLGRIVALKVIRKEKLVRPDTVHRFQREIRAAAQLHHPNIVRAYDADEVSGTHFFVMEYVEGTDLSALVKEQGPLPINQACDFMRQAGLGLQHAFERGMVHRDIKPANLLLTTLKAVGSESQTSDGTQATQATFGPVSFPLSPVPAPLSQSRIKILDMGLALLEVPSTEDTQSGFMTQTGAVMGTPDYMAPEQGRDSHSVDIRADLYSLGCTFYFLLAGRVPFPGGSFTEKLLKHQLEQPESLRAMRPEIPEAVQAIVAWLMAKKPSDRYQTPAQLVQALDQARCSPLANTTIPEVGNGPSQSQDTESLFRLGSPPEKPLPAPGERSLPMMHELRRRQEHQRLLKRGLAIGGVFVVLLIALVGGALYLLSTASEKSPDHQGPPVVVPPKKKPAWIAGAPLSPLALVSRPSAIPGVQSWTIDSRAHRGSVGMAAYSADSKRLASGGDDGTVRLWEPGSGQLVRILVGHGRRISRLAWAPDGKILASGSDDSSIRLWDPDTGKLLHTLAEHNGAIGALAWSPEGKTLASGSADKTVMLWDPASGQARSTFDFHQAGIISIVWQPEKTLASTDSSNKVWVLDAASGKPLHSHQAQNPRAWSADRKVLVHKSADKTVTFWEPQDNQSSSLTLKELDDPFQYLAISPDGKILATGGKNWLQLWDADSGQLRRSYPVQNQWRLAFSPDGQSLATSGNYKDDVYQWSTAAEAKTNPVHNFKGAANPSLLAWSPDGKILFARDYTYKFFDVAARKLALRLPHTGEGGDAAWSPDGQQVVLGLGHNKARIWSADSGQFLRFAGDGSTHWGSQLDWSRDGKTLAILFGQPPVIGLYDANSGLRSKILKGHVSQANVVAIAWSPDDQKLATSGSGVDDFVRLWDTATAMGTILLTPGVPYHALAWSPDSQVLATGGPRIKLWEGNSGQTYPSTIEAGKTNIHALAWSPDGLILASGNAAGRIQLWNTKTGELLKTNPGHNGVVHALAWMPNGKTVVSLGESDGTVRFWGTDDEQPVRVIKGLPGRPRFSPDLKLLLTHHDWGRIQIWETETGRHRGTLLNHHNFALNADGHCRLTGQAPGHFVYVVQTKQGQNILTPEEFEKKYNWMNDPEKIRLVTFGK